jgi:4-hydroxyphenylacetate 3-monooxygenase
MSPSPSERVSHALELRVLGGDHRVAVAPRELVVAGFTGRDEEAVHAHIEELAREGVPRPSTVPAFYRVDAALLTTAPAITVRGPRTSGEAEPVLFCAADGWYVGLGSDHTDRDLEREDIGRSKSACPKVISTEVLPYELARARWDDLRLRSWVSPPSAVYQDGSAGDLLPIPEVLGKLGPSDGADGLVVFCGTVALATDGFVFGDEFRAELTLPGGEGSIGLSYRIDLENGGR